MNPIRSLPARARVSSTSLLGATRASTLACASLLLLTVLGTPAWAGPFDVILADSVDLTLCQGCGITLAGLDYGLIVNTGTSDITIPDLLAARFAVTASRSEVVLYPFLNIPNEQIVGAIHPGEAMGSIVPGNQLLLPLLRPGETLRNLAEMQFMAYEVERGNNTYEGPVRFDVTMTLAGYTVRFAIRAQVHLGLHAISFLTATRVSAVLANQAPICSGAVASTSTLWPPNGRMVPIEIVGVTDADGDPVTISATGITQDEPVGSGGGPVAPRACGDGQIVDGRAWVRAERSGGGNGRVYEIRFVAADGRGGQCEGKVSVCVPAQPDQTCADDGQYYDSVQECARGGVAAGLGPLRLETIVAGREPMLEYSLTGPADVAVDLFDVAGRRVASLERGARSTGRHAVRWSSRISPGVYFLRVRAGDQVLSPRIIVVGD